MNGLRIFLTLILFIFVWLGLSGFKTGLFHLFFALAAPVLTLYFANKLALIDAKNRFSLYGTIYYLFWLISEIISSSIAVSKIAWRRNLAILPSISAITSIQTNDLGRVVYANSITLTPGTVTIKLEKSSLLIHSLDINFIEDLKNGVMDKKIKKIIL